MGQTSGLGNKHRPPYREGWRTVSSMDFPAGAFTGVKNTLFFQKMRFCLSCESPMTTRGTEISQPFTSTGKERDRETGFSYFGARYYDCDLSGLFLSVDPMADKYPTISPYAYCMWNPVKLVDLKGRDVLPISEDAYQMILNTLPIEAREYVKLNDEGKIDAALMEKYDCSSQNYNDLKTLAGLGCTIEVSVSETYDYYDENGDLKTSEMYYSNQEMDALLHTSIPIKDMTGPYALSTKETGDLGVTEIPIMGAKHRSTNDNIKVIINKKLSDQGRSESFAHEFFGHAYIFATTADYSKSIHSTGNTETNYLLRDRIINSQNEVKSIWK